MFLSEKEKKETIWACRFCMMCQTADRVGEIVRNEAFTPRGRGAIIQALDKGLLQWDTDVAETIFTTLNDGRLQEWCVGNYDHEELVIETRAQLFERGLVPEELSQYLRGMDAYECRHETLFEDLQAAGVDVKDKAKTLLYLGHDDSPEINMGVVRLCRMLSAAGVDFTIGHAEPLSGYEYYQAGDFSNASKASIALTEWMKATGAETVIVLEAESYRMLTTRTKRFGGDTTGLAFEHFSTVLAKAIESGALEIKKPLSGVTVTYQDPCNLSRYCNIVDGPRRMLHRIGAELVEMDSSGKMAYCCGAGGLLPVYKPDLALEIAKKRCVEAAETNASLLVSSCYGCHSMLSNGLRHTPGSEKIKAVHLIDLVGDALGL